MIALGVTMDRTRGRWVLRYREPNEPPAGDVDTIEHAVRVVERTARMLLIEATPDELADLVGALPHWTAAKERSSSLMM
jgi:hypothetical protein